MAACASASLPISTKPNPLDRPVSRSMITCADWTVPCASKSCCRSLSAIPYGRWPTYNFLPMEGLREKDRNLPPPRGRRGSTKHERLHHMGRGKGIGREGTERHQGQGPVHETQVRSSVADAPAGEQGATPFFLKNHEESPGVFPPQPAAFTSRAM